MSPYLLSYSGGTQGDGSLAVLALYFDVADQGTNPGAFTLRQTLNTPITNASPAPEPSSVAAFGFVGLGVAGLMWKARKRA